MSSTTQNGSISTLSSSSSSSSHQRRSYPTTPARKDPIHCNHRDVHSAPATFAQQPSSRHASDLTLSSSSSDDTSSSSTAIASSTTSTSTSTSTSPSPQTTRTSPKTHPHHPQLSAEDAYYSAKINAEHAANSEAKLRNGVTRGSAKQKRGCMGALADEFDFGYANIATRETRGGKKIVGGTGLGKCELM